MTVTTNGTSEAATVSTAAAQSRMEQMAAELQGQLDEAKASREAILATLKEHDQLVDRLQVAVRALAGPTPRGPYNKSGHKTAALKAPDPELLQLVEVTIARAEDPIGIPDLVDRIPHRPENTIRRMVYTLRDEGRIRIVKAQKGPFPTTYAAMPEVVEEHAV